MDNTLIRTQKFEWVVHAGWPQTIEIMPSALRLQVIEITIFNEYHTISSGIWHGN
jgi:hypothetical protein